MSRLGHTGAESQNVLEVGSPSGVSVSTSKYTGTGSAASWKLTGAFANNATPAAIGCPNVTASSSTFYIKQDMYIETLDDASGNFKFGIRAFSVNGVYMSATSQNEVRIYNDGGTLKLLMNINYESGTAGDSTLVNLGVGLNTWFRLEVCLDTTPADGSEIFQVKIDGTTVINRTDLNFHVKTVTAPNVQMLNSTGGGTYNGTFYIDNMAVNTGSGSINNSWIGEESIVALVPTSFGDSTPDSGSAAAIAEIPAGTSATASYNYCALSFSSSAYYMNITDPTTYMNSYDIVNAVSVPTFVREATSGTTSYQTGIKSAAGATPTLTTTGDAGDTTVRVSPLSTTANSRLLLSETDPTTGARWKVTGTNSLSNAQIGAKNNNGSATWYTAQQAMVAFSPGSPATTHGMLLLFW